MAYDPSYETGIKGPLPGQGWLISDGGGGFGGSGGSGGGSLPNPFIPVYGQGGQAQGWGGMGPDAVWGGGGGMGRRRLPMGGARMAFSGGGQQPMQGAQGMPNNPNLPGWMQDWARSQNPASAPGGGDMGPFSMGAGPMGPMGALIQNAMRGGDPNYGGAFSLNGSSAVRQGMRGQMIQDAGAQERAARLGLQARGDTDPSTYGFQALMSQLGGQDRTAKAMSAADLGMKQQQMQQYWQMLSQLLSGQLGVDQTERQGRWSAAAQPSGLAAGADCSVANN